MKNLKIKDLEKVSVVFDQVEIVSCPIDKERLQIEIEENIMELLKSELCLEVGDFIDRTIDVEKDIWYQAEITDIHWGYFADDFRICIDIRVWSD